MIIFLRVVAGLAFAMMAVMLFASFGERDGATFFSAWPVFGIWGTIATCGAAILAELRSLD